ncbi:hypothetical protein CAEBREN_28227 [Caenorhabditis brenneri]|uniref:Uncharacterized protein n=1 Tax=Caenorhabditis brenneri TaxID=135651 RepID=G0NH00_CAEBE|nr:hypothetical protein CAEBREN_28227 [Caenorhabditis brenneri]
MSTMDLRRKLSDSRSSSESSSDAVTQKSSLEIHSLGGATSPSLLPVSTMIVIVWNLTLKGILKSCEHCHLSTRILLFYIPDIHKSREILLKEFANIRAEFLILGHLVIMEVQNLILNTSKKLIIPNSRTWFEKIGHSGRNTII